MVKAYGGEEEKPWSPKVVKHKHSIAVLALWILPQTSISVRDRRVGNRMTAEYMVSAISSRSGGVIEYVNSNPTCLSDAQRLTAPGGVGSS